MPAVGSHQNSSTQGDREPAVGPARLAYHGAIAERIEVANEVGPASQAAITMKMP